MFGYGMRCACIDVYVCSVCLWMWHSNALIMFLVLLLFMIRSFARQWSLCTRNEVKIHFITCSIMFSHSYGWECSAHLCQYLITIKCSNEANKLTSSILNAFHIILYIANQMIWSISLPNTLFIRLFNWNRFAWTNMRWSHMKCTGSIVFHGISSMHKMK